MTQLERVLLQLRADLLQLGVGWAVVGGFAVSIRSRPRTTFDIDLVVSVATDRDAESLIHSLRERGYVLERILEQEATGRMAGARLMPPPEVGSSAPVDLLFASSGIEIGAKLVPGTQLYNCPVPPSVNCATVYPAPIPC